MTQLGINPTMDRHARLKGLPHWSCITPTCTDKWMREDGQEVVCPITNPGGYIEALKLFDKKNPME